ncbi:E3 ubiquitin-protein ligase TRAIP-like isoform X1 [Linepithema humile]|uniref:E3 ubiquitin-protein ligase TRAIP-like isoform X1 n=1 Tax=Linepithema humile TaxID=83485 RepID=UPI00351F29BA
MRSSLPLLPLAPLCICPSCRSSLCAFAPFAARSSLRIRENFRPFNDVFNTPCGHTFHHDCLLKWLERSQNCPQCRERTTKHEIHRIYFNFPNNDSLVEDAAYLQNKLDNVTFHSTLKDSAINNLVESKQELEKQTSDLKQEVKNVERKLKSKKAAIRALQKQIKFFKQQCAELDECRKDNDQLKEKVENLQNLQVILEGSESEVDEIITRTTDYTKLATYIKVLKREKTTNCIKRQLLQLINLIKSVKHKLMESYKKSKVLEEEHMKRKELETQLNSCITEKISLQNQLLDKQASMHCVCNNVCVENQNYLRNNFEKYEKTFGKKDIVEAMKLQDSLNSKKDNNCIIIEPDNNDKKWITQEKINVSKENKRLRLENILKRISSNNIELGSNENTPQNMKSKDFFSLSDCGNEALKRTCTNLKISPILAKKSKFSQPNQKTVSENCNGMT